MTRLFDILEELIEEVASRRFAEFNEKIVMILNYAKNLLTEEEFRKLQEVAISKYDERKEKIKKWKIIVEGVER